MGTYNKIIINDEVILDLSADTVTANKLIEGVTAHNADGLQITGKLKKYNWEYEGNLEILEPTMYLYGHEATNGETADVTINGVGYVGAVLPKLPKWDKESYPYAVILANAPYGLADPEIRTAYLYLGNKPFYHGSFLVPYSLEFYESGVYQEYRLDTDVSNEFVLQKSVEVEALEKFGTSLFEVIWCNLDIYNTSSELYLTGSDPIPVYE